MRHTLRKYLSNRGSALFMVLSTMTALMVCCMAMYFSVVSSRSTQYAIFNQEQAYQSASSLSDAIIASMYNHTGDLAKIGDKISKLNVGEVLTTNSNGFKVFDPAGAGKEDEEQLGAYMVAITRLPDETLGDGTTAKVFDIVITSSVNGIKEAVHNVIQFKETPTERPLPGPTNVFTATGYVPNDVFLDGGNIITDVFFDNEYTVVNAYGSKNMELGGNLSCGGSITLNRYLICSSTNPVTYAIRGNFTNNFNSPITLVAKDGANDVEDNKGRSTVMIGGNAAGQRSFGNSNVYILGDLILDDDYIDSTSKYFVNGNIILKSHNHKLGNVYCNGIVDMSKNNGGTITESVAGTWTEAATGLKAEGGNGIMTKDEMVEALDGKTSTGTYYKWIVDTTGMVTEPKTIHFVGDYTKEPVYTRYIQYGSAEDGKGCTIEDITTFFTGSPGKPEYFNNTLVIDTGDDPNNVYTIKLKGNRDYMPNAPGTKEEDKKETFCWFPRNVAANIKEKTYAADAIPAGHESEYELAWNNGGIDYFRKIIGTDADGNKIYEKFTEPLSGHYGNTSHDQETSLYFKVLIMGRGSVLFDIPDGVTYQDDTFLKVMHYGWYSLHGGKETYFGDADKTGKTKRYLVEHTAFSHPSDNTTGDPDHANDDDFYSQFIHQGCTVGDGCVYTEKTTTEECPNCGGKITNLVCDDHAVVDSYCKACQPNRGLIPCKKHTVYDNNCTNCKSKLATGRCTNRVDKASVDSYVAKDADFYNKHAFMKGKDGKIIYPNVNLFLISCDENASIRFSSKAATTIDGKTTMILQNSFFGYVYAPYMTFKAGPENSGGGMVRLMGGMTVSDYIIDDSYSMLACWPDKIPEDLMGDASFSNPIYGVASKSWKISLKGR